MADWGRPAHVGEMRRLDVTDAQGRRLEPLLPPEKPRTGRPNHDHRRVVSGMLWIHRTGAPWRDRPERYGPVGTVSSRFYRWCRAGVWDRILCALHPSPHPIAINNPQRCGTGEIAAPQSLTVGTAIFVLGCARGLYSAFFGASQCSYRMNPKRRPR